MANKRAMLSNVITKMTDAPVTVTSPGTAIPVVVDGTAFVVGVTKPYSACKVIFPFVKAGGSTVAVQIGLMSDTGAANAYQDLTNTDGVAITPAGTDAEHGYIATTGNGVAEANFDLSQVKVGTNIRVRITANFGAVTTPTAIGPILVQFADARREPPTGTVVSTIA
jgi:hypothetical protein